jgi:uncharacterized SAM-binding protein YcdF (DUF218 family)
MIRLGFATDARHLMRATGAETAAGGAGTRPVAPSPRRRGGLLTLLVFGLPAALFGAGFLWFVGSMPATEVSPTRDADGIVVLTGAALRISDALDLLAAGRGQRLLITGVNPATRTAEISRLMPEHRRLFNCCVDLDHSAINTIGNAVETRRWVQGRNFRSLIVVTSNFHMPRAMAELNHQLPGVTLVPFAVVSDKVRVEAWWESEATARLLFVEYLKYIVARARMWLPESFA